MANGKCFFHLFFVFIISLAQNYCHISIQRTRFYKNRLYPVEKHEKWRQQEAFKKMTTQGPPDDSGAQYVSNWYNPNDVTSKSFVFKSLLKHRWNCRQDEYVP